MILKCKGVLITEDEVSVVNMSRVETTHRFPMEPLEISKDQIIPPLPGLGASYHRNGSVLLPCRKADPAVPYSYDSHLNVPKAGPF